MGEDVQNKKKYSISLFSQHHPGIKDKMYQLQDEEHSTDVNINKYFVITSNYYFGCCKNFDQKSWKSYKS